MTEITIDSYRDPFATAPEPDAFPPSMFPEEFLTHVHERNLALSEQFRAVRGGDDTFSFDITHGEGDQAHSHTITVDYLPVPRTPEEAVLATRPLHGVQPEHDLEAIALSQAYHQHAIYLAEFVRAAHTMEGHPASLCQANALLDLWEATFTVLEALPATDDAAPVTAYLQGAVKETTVNFVVAAANGLKDMIDGAYAAAAADEDDEAGDELGKILDSAIDD
jgi:hypothetical protein